eukprot:GHRQ01036318.1.p1 GENE.GHRQ01036318.1~~GHRQ01036318.1.p1  ORF type:complete len:191 (+),score=22.95 GHRQ01036318.1:302-874(+)
MRAAGQTPCKRLAQCTLSLQPAQHSCKIAQGLHLSRLQCTARMSAQLQHLSIHSAPVGHHAFSFSHEAVARPSRVVVQANSGGLALSKRCLLPHHQVTMRGEVRQRSTLEVGDAVEAMFGHERLQPATQVPHHGVAVHHDARAHLRMEGGSASTQTVSNQVCCAPLSPATVLSLIIANSSITGRLSEMTK